MTSTTSRTRISTTEKRQFTEEELHLLYVDVLVPYAKHQYNTVYERLIDQFEVHESFNVQIIDLFVTSACYTKRQSAALKILSSMASHSSQFTSLLFPLLVEYALAKLSWKSGEFVQCFQICKSLLHNITNSNAQENKEYLLLRARSWYLMAKLYLQYSSGNIVSNASYNNPEEQFKLCLQKTYESDNNSWRVYNKYCDFYIANVFLNYKRRSEAYSQLELLEYGKLNLVISIKCFIKNEISVVVDYNRMKMRKLTSKLALLNVMTHNAGNNVPNITSEYDQLRYYVYQLKQGIGDAKSISEMNNQFKLYYRKGNIDRKQHDLIKLRCVGIYLSLRSEDWDQSLFYCSIIKRYSPELDISNLFFYEFAFFHKDYSLLFEGNLTDIEPKKHSHLSDSYADYVDELDFELLKAKEMHTSMRINQQGPILQYEKLLILLKLKKVRLNSIYLFLMSPRDIKYECHSIIGVRLFAQNKDWMRSIYHLYHALLLRDENTYIWQCFIEIMRREVLTRDIISYIKTLYLYIQHLRQQQLQENFDIIMELQEELNKINSRIQLVKLDNTITLELLSNGYILRQIHSKMHHKNFIASKL